MTELAVLVPVLNRPQNVKPLVESFLAGCPDDSELVFIYDNLDVDEAHAIEDVLADNLRVIAIGGEDTGRFAYGTWPEKINVGVLHRTADWYLCAADDITFTPGWWEATKELRDDLSVGVIGTNDSATGTGNPRVAAGDHTCHPLIRASYIRDFGTVDSPGQAVHSGYHHWFVDDELVHTAKARHAWAYCRDAVIEHNHPYWKPEQVAWDATYAKGESNADADKALFESRVPLIQAEYGKYA